MNEPEPPELAAPGTRADAAPATPADAVIGELHAAILDSATDYAIFSTDLNGRITSWNNGAQKLIGWPADEIIGKHSRIVYTPEDVRRGAAEHEMQIALEDGRAPNERWHVRRDGSRFFGVGLLMPLRLQSDGPIVGFVKIMRDRTPQLYLEHQRDQFTQGHSSEVLRLKALGEAARSIMTAPSLASTLDSIAQAARNIVGAHLAVASLTRQTDWSQAINAVAFSDKYARWREYDAQTDGTGIYAWVCQLNEPVRLTQTDLERHPRWRGFGRHAGQHPPLRGWLAVPMVGTNGGNLGLIQLSDKMQGEFSEADQAIVVQLAQLAAAAVEQVQAREARDRLLEEVQAQQKRTEEILESINDAFYAIDEQARFTYVSAKTAEIWGRARQDLIGRNYWAEFPTAAGSESHRMHEQVMRTRQPVHYETISPLLNRWIDVSIYPAAGGGLSCYFRNIDKRKRAEAALRDSEERFRLAMESASLGTIDYDCVKGQLYWSASVRRFHGIDEDAPIAPDYALERIHPDDREQVRAVFAGMLQASEEGEHRYQYRISRPDGELRWLDVMARVRLEPDENGVPRVVRIAGVMWDITEQQRLLESLREADARKDEFLAMLAHELRNPLAPLTNAHRLLERSAALTEQNRAALAMAERQTRQLTRLVDDLLEVSRISRGKIELKCEPMLLASAVYDAVGSVTPAIEARRQTLAVDLPRHPSRIVADSARVAQILENLLNNASKYTPEGGSIGIHVQDIESNQVEVRVTDNGVGIDPHKLSQVFELFTQVDATMDRSQGGLGIGLALVKRLVELHGGSVSAASEGRGKGAMFTIRLPRGEPQAH